MFVLKPDPYSLPCYRIGPFQTKDLSVNHRLPDSDRIDNYLTTRFEGKDYMYTYNGREAINIALGYFGLQKDDVVTILTTSGNFYISGCVTMEIEKYCRWSREIVAETKLIFVNHEFGYPYDGIRQLKAYGLPIIEDCASSFFSQDKLEDTGNIGDFVIYSFPKMFPLQVGGLLVSNHPERIDGDYVLPPNVLRHIKNGLSSQIVLKDKIIDQRISNYKYLRNEFTSMGFKERFPLNKGIVPAVFMFSTKGKGINLPELKNYFYAHGVQCSVFYGEEAFFIPVHQSLSKDDMNYFCEIMKAFLDEMDN